MTVADAADLAPGARLEAEVVVVGSGPAGLTVARDLAARSVDVLVLESGGRSITAESRDLDVGESVGTPLRFGEAPFTTADMRIRALGGSSGHWAGMCRPLDPIDLRARDWVPGSGWPLDHADLDPWYRRAEATLGLGTTGWDPAAWYERCGIEPLFASDRLDPAVYQFSPPTRFGEDFDAELVADTGPRVLLGATAVDARLDPAGARIAELDVRRADGEVFPVRATTFVLAVGGLEVPRLLLAWGGAAGIANASGRVGRGYLDHPHRTAGQVRFAAAAELPPLYAWADAPGDEPPVKVWAGWSPTPEVQEAEAIGHGVALLRFADAPDSAYERPTRVTGAARELVAWSSAAAPGSGVRRAVVDVRCEQRPTDESRVTLSRARDATGLPRVRVDWRPGADDDRTARRTVELLAEELGRAGIGRVEIDPRGVPFADLPISMGCHPSGTARMGDDPSSSVVGPDLRSHDLANLYVCGSATFPTNGHANPTLTVVALAHRLADHLLR